MQTALPIASGLTAADKHKLWAAADKLRGHLDAAEDKHVVLGLIFLEYISDAFEEHHAALDAQRADGVDPEDKDEYTAEGTSWVPPDARSSKRSTAAASVTSPSSARSSTPPPGASPR